MTTKTKIFVTLAFIGAAFYTLDVILTLMGQGFVGPVFVKSGLVAVFLFYAITAIKKSKAVTSPVVVDDNKA